MINLKVCRASLGDSTLLVVVLRKPKRLHYDATLMQSYEKRRRGRNHTVSR